MRQVMGGFRFALALAIVFAFVAPCKQLSANNLDSLRLVAAQNDVEQKLPALLELAWALKHSAPDSALIFIEEADELARSLGDTSHMITASIRKGVLLRNGGNGAEAQRLFNRAISLAREQGNDVALSRALINAGQNHKMRGEFEQAIECLLASVELLEDSEYYAYLNVCYSTLGGLYLELEQFNQSAFYFNKALALSTGVDDQFGISKALYNLGVVQFEIDSFATSLMTLQKALALSEQLGDEMQQAKALNAIGSIYFAQNEMQEAIIYYRKALPLCIAYGMQIEQASVLNNLAAIYELESNWEMALSSYQEAATLASEMGNRTNLYQIYLNLSETYQKMQKADSALVFYQLYSVLKDSVFNEESNRQIVEVQTKYETAKKDESIANLRAIEGEQQVAIERRNLWLISAVILAVSLAFALIVYFSKLRIQRALNERNEELHQQAILRLVNESDVKSMKAHLAGETAERKRLASELHDRLGSQLATVKLYYDQLEENVQDEQKKAMISKANLMLDQSCTDVRKIAHDLAADTLHEFGLETAVANMARAISDSGKLNLKMHAIAMDQRLPFTSELVLFRSIQELLTNIIKHAEATEVAIKISGLNDQVEVTIVDNGRGFNTASSDYKSGLGLATINERISNLDGRFTIGPTTPGGTKAIITIPLETTIPTKP